MFYVSVPVPVCVVPLCVRVCVLSVAMCILSVYLCLYTYMGVCVYVSLRERKTVASYMSMCVHMKYVYIAR